MEPIHTEIRKYIHAKSNRHTTLTVHPQDKFAYAIRSMLYPVSGSTPKSVWVPVRTAPPPSRPGMKWAGDLDVRKWFPTGYTMTNIKEVPQVSPPHALSNAYTVFIGEDRSTLAENNCIHTTNDISFHGNILVVRRGSQKPDTITHLPSNERTLVNLVVFRYVSGRVPDIRQPN